MTTTPPTDPRADLGAVSTAARYGLAARLGIARRVLDVGCGDGAGARLLLSAGAAAVTDLDRDARRIALAQEQVPAAKFAVGEATQLPFEDGAFDVVVCFGAIDGSAELAGVLGEVLRVLDPQGFVIASPPIAHEDGSGSSRTPRAFGIGQLRNALARCLPHHVLIEEHLQIASLLACRDALPADQLVESLVLPLTSGDDHSAPSGVVIAGRTPLPVLPVIASCARSRTLLADEALRERVRAQHELLARERAELAEERRQLGYERAERRYHGSPDDRGLAERIASLELEVERLRRDRERMSVMLLEGEQRLAEALTATDDALREQEEALSATAGRQISSLQREVERLRTELAVIAKSKSWRLTRPLRGLADRTRAGP